MLNLPLDPQVLVEDAVREFPSSAAFLRGWGIVCLQCGEPVWGTLGEIIRSKGLDADRVLTALNEHLLARK
jgi:hypothetical protein